MMDGFPVTFLEAAACQRPVITKRLPSYAGTFAENYFDMVEPDDIDALADAMVQTVNGSCAASASSLAEARAIIETSFSETTSAQRLMAIYRSLVSGPGAVRQHTREQSVVPTAVSNEICEVASE
jgi:glycosyltransferase involved in cell wall biosynthesis